MQGEIMHAKGHYQSVLDVHLSVTGLKQL